MTLTQRTPKPDAIYVSTSALTHLLQRNPCGGKHAADFSSSKVNPRIHQRKTKNKTTHLSLPYQQ